MKRVRVVSSSVTSVGYDPATQTLEVEFAGGSIYRYFDVPEGVHARLIAADSKGTFLNVEIKPAFRFARRSRRATT